MKLFLKTKNGGFAPIPEPPFGYGYLPIAMPNELLHKIEALDAHGHWERELAGILERETRQFFERRPVDAIRTVTRNDELVKFYDPRDPLKHPLDRRPNVI